MAVRRNRFIDAITPPRSKGHVLMNCLPEDQSDKARRTLAAAHDLLTTRGIKAVTMSDVAEKAYVGKGTVYLYWPTKDDLLVGLIARDMLAVVDTLVAELTADPELARPSRFCLLVFQTITNRPLVAAFDAHDRDLLGAILEHPRAMAFDEALGPRALVSALVPVWRRFGLARTDWDVEEQVLSLHALTIGIKESTVRPLPRFAGDYTHVYRKCVTALLGPEDADEAQIASAASEIIDKLSVGRAAARSSLVISESRQNR